MRIEADRRVQTARIGEVRTSERGEVHPDRAGKIEELSLDRIANFWWARLHELLTAPCTQPAETDRKRSPDRRLRDHASALHARTRRLRTCGRYAAAAIANTDPTTRAADRRPAVAAAETPRMQEVCRLSAPACCGGTRSCCPRRRVADADLATDWMRDDLQAVPAAAVELAGSVLSCARCGADAAQRAGGRQVVHRS